MKALIQYIKQRNLFAVRLSKAIKDTLTITLKEYRLVFRDSGVLIIFVGASLIYPLLYCTLYKNETLYDVPVAVVDHSHSVRSRELIRKMDATPELKVAVLFDNLEQAKCAFERREIHGVIYVPEDYSEKINRMEQATISTYCDMSSFLYYRAMTLATNYAVLNAGEKIEMERLHAAGMAGKSAEVSVHPMTFKDNILYNNGMGFASFLMPAVLILILHQTLFFGISMLAGTAREENRFRSLLPVDSKKRHLLQLITGKSMCYFSLYAVLTAYILGVIPRLFNLPHIGQPVALIGMAIPFLLATIFFSMTVSVFMRNRETGMVFFLFFSLILLFISGFSWPRSNMPSFWLAISWLFPATHGIQGYLKINSMGATLRQISFEYISLWILAAIYFVTTLIAYAWQIRSCRLRTAESGKDAVGLSNTITTIN